MQQYKEREEKEEEDKLFSKGNNLVKRDLCMCEFTWLSLRKTYEHQARLVSTLVEIEKLVNEIIYHKKLLQICDEIEHDYNEEIINLKTQLEELRRIEEVMKN